MNGSPAISSEKRVQRWHSTQRSRSSSTCVEIGSGFGNVRFVSRKRESVRPVVIAWFCSGHSPPLSQMGAVEGVVDEQQLHHPLLRLLGDRGRVLGAHDHAVGDGHRAAGLRLRHGTAAHLHLDQALAAGARDRGGGWSQNRGTMIPSRSHVRMRISPLGGASTSRPSMVSRTYPSGTGAFFSSGAMVTRAPVWWGGVIMLVLRSERARPSPPAGRRSGRGTPGGST